MVFVVSRLNVRSKSIRLANSSRVHAPITTLRRRYAIASTAQQDAPDEPGISAASVITTTQRACSKPGHAFAIPNSGWPAVKNVPFGITSRKERCDIGRVCWEGAQLLIASSDFSTARLREQLEGDLQAQGHDSRFIDAWVGLLAGKNDATLAVEGIQSNLDSDMSFYVPYEVLKTFLKVTSDVTPVGIATLLEAFRRTLQRRELVQADPLATSLLTRQVFEQLMRLVCASAPDLVPKCAELSVQALTLLLLSGDRGFVSHEANMLMQILAMPVKEAPFRAAKMQLDAVVDILQFMAEQEPPLLVSAMGYEAFVKVQLRLGRTEAEKEWASLQAQSWPPWKMDRNAVDSLRNPESGWSRAKVAMARMTEDGFSATPAMRVASIYSGHDLDGTPTVQTRAVLPDITMDNVVSEVWRARIQATRTRKEAWASWLAYEGALKGGTPAANVIRLMISKLAASNRCVSSSHHQRTQRKHQHNYEEFFPGEFTEIVPEPASVHLHTFTPVPPPDIWGFFQRLLKNNVVLTESTVRSLLMHTFDLNHAARYLEIWRPEVARALLGHDTADLGIVPADVVAAFAQVLISAWSGGRGSRFDRKLSLVAVSSNLSQDAMRLDISERFQKAVWLLHAHTNARRQDSRHWRPVFAALVHSPTAVWTMSGSRGSHTTRAIERRYVLPVRLFHQCRGRVLALRTAQQCASIMSQRALPVDYVIFDYICRAMAKAGEALRWATYQRGIVNAYCWQGLTLPYELIITEARLIEQEGPHEYIMSVYKQWSGIKSTRSASTTWDSGFLHPANAHSWVRAVGNWGNHEALHDLIVWIIGHKIVKYDDTVIADRRHVRRLVIGVAVLLETVDPVDPSFTLQEVAGDDQEDLFSNFAKEKLYSVHAMGAPQDIREDVEDLLEEAFGPELGAWPSKDEIMQYIITSTGTSANEQEESIIDEQGQSLDMFMR